MSKARIWELLAKKFNKEITEEELRELQSLLSAEKDPMPSSELLQDLEALRIREGFEDKSRKKRSMEAIRMAMGAKEGEPGDDPAQPTGEMSAARPNAEMNAARPKTEMSDAALSEYPASHRRPWRRALTLTASALLLAAGTYFVYRGHTPAAAPEAFNMIVTKPGSKTLITLPDGSKVVLNSACRFGYNKEFGVSNRSMILSGEAYFDIHKNPDMPLSLSAGNVNIKVLGTSFNVRAYVEDSFVEATLIKGSIQVSLKSDPERAILLRPHEKIVISNEAPRGKTTEADSTMSATTGATSATPRAKTAEQVIAVSKVDPEPGDSMYVETAWISDKLVFNKEPFPLLAARMERWFHIRIIIADSALDKMTFTGSFEQENIRQAFEALHNSARFTYRIDGQTVTVRR